MHKPAFCERHNVHYLYFAGSNLYTFEQGTRSFANDYIVFKENLEETGSYAGHYCDAEKDWNEGQ